ncbi:MAG TPA: chromate transporter [Burkholderiaceae bacterium]|nr:chromate transporter [Burkholderiaceae bacterium]
MTPPPLLHGSDWWGLFGQFLLLSLLSIGGAIGTAPEMHRYLVEQHHWLTDEQFSASIALAQSAPGPNLLFVAVLGWAVGGALGASVTLAGILLPSTTLALAAARWGHARRDSRGVKTFVNGMAPLTVGLVLSTGWILGLPSWRNLALVATIAVTVVLCLRTRLSPLWLIAGGAIVGALLGR